MHNAFLPIPQAIREQALAFFLSLPHPKDWRKQDMAHLRTMAGQPEAIGFIDNLNICPWGAVLWAYGHNDKRRFSPWLPLCGDEVIGRFLDFAPELADQLDGREISSFIRQWDQLNPREDREMWLAQQMGVNWPLGQ